MNHTEWEGEGREGRGKEKGERREGTGRVLGFRVLGLSRFHILWYRPGVVFMVGW